MKTILTLLGLLFCTSIFAQQIKGIKINNYKSPVEEYQKDFGGKLFNDKMMNIMFAEKVGTAFGNSSDLSLQKFYASLSATDNSLSIGYNYNPRENELKKLNAIWSFGMKAKAANKFSTLAVNGDLLENNIGLTFKLALIGNGKINFNEKKDSKGKILIYRKKAVKAYRKELYKSIDKKVDYYNTKLLSGEINAVNLIAQNNITINSQLAAEQTKIKQNKLEEFYKEIARSEIDYLNKHKLYNFVSDRWFSFDLYLPLGHNIYKTTPNTSNPLIKQEFFPFTATSAFTYFREYSSGWSYYILPKLTVKNNNNILVDNLDPKIFQTFSTGLNGVQVSESSNKVYVTNYDAFLTTTLRAEIAIFFFDNWVGLSPAVEKNFGTYDTINWKLGIPFSLKDKKGKPTINFELQWREDSTFGSSNHFIGISTNFVFGQFID